MSGEPLHFAQPEWAVLLWAWLAVVVVLALLERRGSDAIDRLIAPALRERLVDRPSRWRRWTRLALLAIAGASLCLALMQPQWGLRTVATPRIGAEIMIALDVSRSMLADDAKPSRLAPGRLPDLFRGSRLVVAGRYEGTGAMALRLRGRLQDDVKQYVHLLRNKVDRDSAAPKRIQNVKGFGYKLVP